MHQDQPPSSSSSSTNVVLIVVVVVVGLFVVCGGVIIVCLAAISVLGSNASGKFSTVADKIGGGDMVKKGMEDADTVASTFLDRIRFNDDDQAYNMTSSDYRRQTTRAEFVVFVSRSPILRNNAANVTVQSRTDNQVICQGTIRGGDGETLNARIHLVKEGGQWKVDQFTIMGQ